MLMEGEIASLAKKKGDGIFDSIVFLAAQRY